MLSSPPLVDELIYNELIKSNGLKHVVGVDEVMQTPLVSQRDGSFDGQPFSFEMQDWLSAEAHIPLAHLTGFASLQYS